MVPIGFSNWNSFETPAAVGDASTTPVALTTTGNARCVTFSPRISAAAVLTAVKILAYSPHRQMLPDRPSAIWAVVGFGFAPGSWTVDMMNPRVQMPQWNL